MISAHGTLGMVLFVVYLAIAVAAFLLAGRAGERYVLPPWLTGTAHALLGIQVLMGIILFARYPHAMPVSHAVAGIGTVLALGLMAPLNRRYGRARGLGISAALIALLAAIAIGIAETR